jgi:hypothetical protein
MESLIEFWCFFFRLSLDFQGCCSRYTREEDTRGKEEMEAKILKKNCYRDVAEGDWGKNSHSIYLSFGCSNAVRLMGLFVAPEKTNILV